MVGFTTAEFPCKSYVLFADICSMAERVLKLWVWEKPAWLWFATGVGCLLLTRLAMVWTEDCVDGWESFCLAGRGAAIGTIPEPLVFYIIRSSFSIFLALVVAVKVVSLYPPALFTELSPACLLLSACLRIKVAESLAERFRLSGWLARCVLLFEFRGRMCSGEQRKLVIRLWVVALLKSSGGGKLLLFIFEQSDKI